MPCAIPLDDSFAIAPISANTVAMTRRWQRYKRCDQALGDQKADFALDKGQAEIERVEEQQDQRRSSPRHQTCCRKAAASPQRC